MEVDEWRSLGNRLGRGIKENNDLELLRRSSKRRSIPMTVGPLSSSAMPRTRPKPQAFRWRLGI